MPLVSQPSLMPTRKVTAGALAGILATAVISGVDAYWPGVGTAMGPQITAAVTTIFITVASYMTKERAH